MRVSYNIKPITSTQKGSVKKNFVLLPENKVAPLIAIQPADGLQQTTYITIDNKPKPLIAVNNKATVLKNTDVKIKVTTTDPSNILDPTSLANLKIVWKFNGAELTQFNQLNDGKGVDELSLKKVTLLQNGQYNAEVSNAYGTTITNSVTLEIIDPDNSEYFHNNLIQNSTGAAGLTNWTADQDVMVSQFESSYTGVDGFASILNNGKIDPIWKADETFQKPKPRFLGELPFKFSTSPNKTNFNIVWKEVGLGVKTNTFDELRNYPATVIGNEAPSKPYSQFFPSPYAIDAYNKNYKGKRGLTLDLKGTPTYFTRDKIQFNASQTSTLTQTVDISSISNTIDGNTPGIDEITAQFFCYLGAGIAKYNYELVNSSGDVVKVLNTYIVSPIMWGRFLANDPEFVKTDIPNNVVKINLVPVLEDISTIQLKCIDANGSLLDTINVDSPTQEDVWAIKEKMFISSYINKLFNLTTNFDNKIPVYVNNKKYFDLVSNKEEKLTKKITNKNREWLVKNYPKYIQTAIEPYRKYTLEAWENGSFTVKGFDKGAAALFGYNKTFQIPVRTRSIQVVASFTNVSQAKYDQNPKSFINGYKWIYNDIYATHLAAKGIYQYNYPKAAATLFKLILNVNKLEDRNAGSYNYPTYFIPQKNVWYDSKKAIRASTMDETLGYTTYMAFDGPYDTFVNESTEVATVGGLDLTNLQSGTLSSTITTAAVQVPQNTTSRGVTITPTTASVDTKTPTTISTKQVVGKVTKIKQIKSV